MAEKDFSNDKGQKNFLGIYFECCNIYTRIYKNKTGDAYEGKCPKCFKKVFVPIGDKGSAERFFKAN